jgi:hypothetical protein
MYMLHYFSERWQARIPFHDMFWRDLIIRGTAINLLVLFVGLLLIARGYPATWAFIAHLLLIPYNFFLFLAVMRWPGVQAPFKAIAGGWFVLATLI